MLVECLGLATQPPTPLTHIDVSGGSTGFEPTPTDHGVIEQTQQNLIVTLPYRRMRMSSAMKSDGDSSVLRQISLCPSSFCATLRGPQANSLKARLTCLTDS